MLREAKLACQAMDPEYEPELCRLISAALIEMRTRGIDVKGEFTYTIGEVQDPDDPEGETRLAVTEWECTITDDWIKTTALTWVKAKAPWTENPEKLMEAYENMLDKMMHTTGYHRGWETEDG